jgi:hypothetical protein
MTAKQDSDVIETLPFAGACRQHSHVLPTECTTLVGVSLIKKKIYSYSKFTSFSKLECVSAFHSIS